jgi:hypothetical protein
MISIAFLILFMAFYILYNTSQKVIKSPVFGFETWAHKNNKKAKLLGITLLFASCFLLCLSFGFGAGMLLFFVVLMTFGSLVIMLTPIQITKPKSIVFIFLIALFTEFFIF